MATVEYQAENENDAPYLSVLEIFYYILAGLNFWSCLVYVYQLIQIQAVQNHASQVLSNISPGLLRNAPSPRMTSISVLVLFFIGLTVAVGIGQIMAGTSLRSRQNYMLCLVVAGVSCFLGTLGTAVGVATFLVMVRPSVKRLFAQATL